MVSREQFENQIRIIQNAEKAFYNALKNTQALIKQTGWGDDDIRISMFGKLSGVLNSAVVSLYFLQNHLTTRKWWEETYKENLRIFEPSIPQTIACFDGQTKTAFYLGAVAVAESAFRILTRAVDLQACSGGDAAFAGIYVYLLNKTGHNSDKNIYDLLRYIRNTKLHSDGIFEPTNNKNAQVLYRGTKYEFFVGKPFEKASWELITNLAQDTLDSMLRIVKSPIVSSHPKILDPQKIK